MKTFKSYLSENNSKLFSKVFKFRQNDKIIFKSKEEADEWLKNIEKVAKNILNDSDFKKFQKFKVSESSDKSHWVIDFNTKVLSGFYPNVS